MPSLVCQSQTGNYIYLNNFNGPNSTLYFLFLFVFFLFSLNKHEYNVFNKINTVKKNLIYFVERGSCKHVAGICHHIIAKITRGENVSDVKDILLCHTRSAILGSCDKKFSRSATTWR